MVVCGYCRAELSEEPKKESKKQIIIVILVILLILGGVGTYFGTANLRLYSKVKKNIETANYKTALEQIQKLNGYKDVDDLYYQCQYGYAKSFMDSEDYENAILEFEKISDYEDVNETIVSCKYEFSKQLIEAENYENAHSYLQTIYEFQDSIELDEMCIHQIDISNDTEAPVISGLEDVVTISCGTDFNIKEYIAEKISINDNVSGTIEKYSVTCDNEAFDQGTGVIDTMVSNTMDIIVLATDEAGNKATFDVKLIIEPVHIKKDYEDNVLYDGQYGKIKLVEYTKKPDEYYFNFEFENRTSKNISVYLSTYTSINEYQVGAYHLLTSIGAGKTGTMYSYIDEEDIPESIGDFNQIDAIVCLCYTDEDSSFFRFDTVFDTDAAK